MAMVSDQGQSKLCWLDMDLMMFAQQAVMCDNVRKGQVVVLQFDVLQLAMALHFEQVVAAAVQVLQSLVSAVQMQLFVLQAMLLELFALAAYAMLDHAPPPEQEIHPQ